MASAELIGRMGAGVMRFDSVRTSKAVDSLSKAELAGVLAKLSPAEMNIALAKYGDDGLSRDRLCVNVQAWVCELAVREGWKPRNRDVLIAMALLAIHEVVDGGLCDKCHGTGMASMIRLCKSCNGIGHRSISGRGKAGRIGVLNAQWLSVWKTRYELVFDYVNGLDSAVLKRLHFAKF